MKLPALNVQGGRGSPRSGGPGSPSAPLPQPADEGSGLRAEASYSGPPTQREPLDDLPPRAMSTPPDLPPPGTGPADASALRGSRGRGAVGGWAVRESAYMKPSSSEPHISSAHSYAWAKRAGMHSPFGVRALTVEAEMVPTGSGKKRLDSRFARGAAGQSGAWEGAEPEPERVAASWLEDPGARSFAKGHTFAGAVQIDLGPGQLGSLSPEHLRSVHGMPEADIEALYRALRVYTLGFHEKVEEICRSAADRRALLVKIWRLFGRLWDSSLQVVFDSEILTLGAERQRAMEAARAASAALEEAQRENELMRGKFNEMVNQALTHANEDRSTSAATSAMHAEVEQMRQTTAALASQSARDTSELGKRDEELFATKKQLYRLEATMQSRAEELADMGAELEGVRAANAELSSSLKVMELQVEANNAAMAEAMEVRDAAIAEKEDAVKLANAARHDMFEERRAKRLLQVDVEHVRGEIIERREEVKAMQGRIQGYIDAAATAEAQVRQAISWRQHETDRAEEYERDIQTLVVAFNHMQDEIVLNEELKDSVKVLSVALDAKREKKRFWKQKTTELRRHIEGIQREAEAWTQERENEKRKHSLELEALMDDIKKGDETNKDLHSRLKPLRLELSDAKQRLRQLQMSRTTAKIRLEAANKRTAELVNALAENIRLLTLERDKVTNLADDNVALKLEVEQLKGELTFAAEDHAVNVARLQGDIKKAEAAAKKWEAQLKYVREEAGEAKQDLSMQLTGVNTELLELQAEVNETSEENARLRFKVEEAGRKAEEAAGQMGELEGKLAAAREELRALAEVRAVNAKYAAWLGAAGDAIARMRDQFREFLAAEPGAPVMDARAWSGCADGALGARMGDAYERDEVVIKLDNQWEDLAQETGLLLQLVGMLKEDKDGLKGELGDTVLKYDDMVAELRKEVKLMREAADDAGVDCGAAKGAQAKAQARASELEKANAELEVELHEAMEEVGELRAQVSALEATSSAAGAGEIRAVEASAELEARMALERQKSQRQSKRVALVGKLLRAGHAEAAKGEKERREALDVLQRQLELMRAAKNAQEELVHKLQQQLRDSVAEAAELRTHVGELEMGGGRQQEEAELDEDGVPVQAQVTEEEREHMRRRHEGGLKPWQVEELQRKLEEAEEKVQHQAQLLAESDVVAVEEKYRAEMEELQAAKDAAYGQLVAAEDAAAELQRRVAELESAAPAAPADGADSGAADAFVKVVNVTFGV